MVVDSGFAQEKEIAYNPGKNEQSIIMSSADYLRIVNPEVQNIAKEPAVPQL
jgi:prolyl-tRNA editing enzyme YbaK/EbsC (Cys-tRNA(Pro) deacylase)